MEEWTLEELRQWCEEHGLAVWQALLVRSVK